MAYLVSLLEKFLHLSKNKKDTHIVVSEMESIFTDIINRAYPNSWDENHITYLLMEAMQTFFHKKTIKFPGWEKVVNWESFKNSGAVETSNGDIAILVNIQFQDGGLLRGVACLEAKRTYPSGNFDQLNQTQIDRIYSNKPHSQLLLYTHDNPKIPIKFPNTKKWDSHLWVTSLNTAREMLPQIRSANGRMLRTAFPFSMFLMSRIFWGQDLHYDTDFYNQLSRGAARNTEFNPSFLGIANIYYDGQQPIPDIVSESWEQIGRPRPSAIT